MSPEFAAPRGATRTTRTTRTARAARAASLVRSLSRALPALTLALSVACSQDAPPSASSTRSNVPSGDELVAAARAAGMVRVTFPDPDPGIPAYARFGAVLNQVFHTSEWGVIPFYRTPDAIADDFDLMSIFDFPGPNGPGAFGVPLTISGHYMIEAGAPLGTFPSIAISKGSAVPFWFVPWSDLEAALADGVLTMGELRALNPVVGTATKFDETLRPRIGEHLVVLNASGTLADGRRFDVHVTHVEDSTRSIRIAIR